MDADPHPFAWVGREPWSPSIRSERSVEGVAVQGVVSLRPPTKGWDAVTITGSLRTLCTRPAHTDLSVHPPRRLPVQARRFSSPRSGSSPTLLPPCHRGATSASTVGCECRLGREVWFERGGGCLNPPTSPSMPSSITGDPRPASRQRGCHPALPGLYFFSTLSPFVVMQPRTVAPAPDFGQGPGLRCSPGAPVGSVSRAT